MRIFECKYGTEGLAMIDVELIPRVAARFKALADEGRLALLSALQRGERSVGELVEATGRPQPNVSQHLANLTHAGLVEARKDGTRVFYRIADPTVLRICDAVCDSLVARSRAERRQASEARRRRRAGGDR
jgi:DNA-binding transcriptional ArsR family regulator